MTQNALKLSPWLQACKIIGADANSTVSMEQRADIIFRASCRILGKNPGHLPNCYDIDNKYLLSQHAQYKLEIIAEAINPENWIQDWNSWEQKKWFPWFYLNKPGFRFRGSGYDYVFTYATGGSRLCLASKSRSDFMGRHCITLYRDLMGGGELAPQAVIV